MEEYRNSKTIVYTPFTPFTPITPKLAKVEYIYNVHVRVRLFSAARAFGRPDV